MASKRTRTITERFAAMPRYYTGTVQASGISRPENSRFNSKNIDDGNRMARLQNKVKAVEATQERKTATLNPVYTPTFKIETTIPNYTLHRYGASRVKLRLPSSTARKHSAHHVLIYNSSKTSSLHIPTTSRRRNSPYRTTRITPPNYAARSKDVYCNTTIAKKKIETARTTLKPELLPPKNYGKNLGICGGEYDYRTSSDIESVSDSYDSDMNLKISRAKVRAARREKAEQALRNPASVLVPSLFPNVPPYLAFSNHMQKGPKVPVALHDLLKWQVASTVPPIVRRILLNSQMRVFKSTDEWVGMWGKTIKARSFSNISCFQKVNHMPGSFRYSRKDSLWRNLQALIKEHGIKEFGFMPKTFIMPEDTKELSATWKTYEKRNVKWIIKPPASSRGTGIRVVQDWEQIPKHHPTIVQKYIERPLLIKGSKFDLRLYVLITSIHPLRIFLYRNGLARFASVQYSIKPATLNDRCIHLTNYSVNKKSSQYTKNEDATACYGHKWSLYSLWEYFAERGFDTEGLWNAIRNLVLRTILVNEHIVTRLVATHVKSKYNYFELLGFDVLLDSNLIPWLLEVNTSPSMHTDLKLDLDVKGPLVQSVLNTALYHVPPQLALCEQERIAADMRLSSKKICYDHRLYTYDLTSEEAIKQNHFTQDIMKNRPEYIDDILEKLTPDDVRCLILAEDELARCSPLERIFPTAETHKYHKFINNSRYYNKLMDAWETRYAHKRAEGRELLRKYCRQNYHLQVPSTTTAYVYTRKTKIKCRNTLTGVITTLHSSDTSDDDEDMINNFCGTVSWVQL